ncbi:MAG: glutathione S-transferase family protein [Alphaproteobacteria bacterium]
MSDTNLVFYYLPRTRSRTVLWMLEELGVPYEMKILDTANKELQSPEFLAINPMGKVPAITHNGTPVTESAAICLYLADAFPEAKLAPALNSPERGAYYRWAFFAAATLEYAMFDKAFNREPVKAGTIGYGDYDRTINVTAQAVAKGPYLLGEHFTAVDVIMGSAIHLGFVFKMLPLRDEFSAYIARFKERPAFQRMLARDKELAEQMGQ